MPTIPGPDGTPFNIDPPQEGKSWSSDEEQNAFYEQLDLKMGEVYLKKMTALGYKATIENAINVYHDQTLKKIIDTEHNELESLHRMNSITALLEEFERKTKLK
jgi:hypothetical protein